jgi:hypothetical protein
MPRPDAAREHQMPDRILEALADTSSPLVAISGNYPATPWLLQLLGCGIVRIILAPLSDR